VAVAAVLRAQTVQLDQVDQVVEQVGIQEVPEVELVGRETTAQPLAEQDKEVQAAAAAPAVVDLLKMAALALNMQPFLQQLVPELVGSMRAVVVGLETNGVQLQEALADQVVAEQVLLHLVEEQPVMDHLHLVVVVVVPQVKTMQALEHLVMAVVAL
jgi:hypothetical protein